MKKKAGLMFMMVLGLFLITGCTDEINYVYPDSKDVTVTLEEFNKLENGMTKQQVWDIIGGECTQSSSSEIPGVEGVMEAIVTEAYGCNGSGSVGANAQLTFQNGELTLKAQHGLR